MSSKITESNFSFTPPTIPHLFSSQVYCSSKVCFCNWGTLKINSTNNFFRVTTTFPLTAAPVFALVTGVVSYQHGKQFFFRLRTIYSIIFEVHNTKNWCHPIFSQTYWFRVMTFLLGYKKTTSRIRDFRKNYIMWTFCNKITKIAVLANRRFDQKAKSMLIESAERKEIH